MNACDECSKFRDHFLQPRIRVVNSNPLRSATKSQHSPSLGENAPKSPKNRPLLRAVMSRGDALGRHPDASAPDFLQGHLASFGSENEP